MDEFKNISYMMSHIFLMLFLYLFNIHRYSKRATAGICIASFFVITATDYLKLDFFSDSSLCYVAVTIFQIIVTQSTNILISAHRNSKVLFMGLSASNYVIAGSTMATVFYYCTEQAFLSLAGSFLVHSAILLILYRRIREIWIVQVKASPAYNRKTRSEPHSMQNWWELCLIPVFFYCTFTFIGYFPYTLDEKPENIPGVLFFMITMFVSYVVVLRYVESEVKKTDIYWKNVLFESHIKGLEDQYELVKQSEQNLKILRHDIRHYSGMIDSLLQQGEYEEIHQIAAHIHDVADANRVQAYCDNLLVNTILSKVMKRAAAQTVGVRLNVKVAREIPVNDYEFTAVIANLLENAMVHIQDYELEERYMAVKIRCDAKSLLIYVENPCHEPIIMDPATGLPKSQKGENHGLGMQSMLAFSSSIKGTIGCSCEEGLFSITLFARF